MEESKTIQHVTMEAGGNNRIMAFGNGSWGQLGQGNDQNQFRPIEIKDLRGKKIIQVACGTHHSLALEQEGLVYSWGKNEEGQLGRSNREKIPLLIPALESFIIVSIACGDSHSLASTSNGLTFSWGANQFGQLGLGDKELRVKPTLVQELKPIFISKVTCGSHHSFFLSSNGDLYSCGDSSNGQLGIGDKEMRKNPTLIKKLVGIPIIDVQGGDFHSLALTISGNVYSFGGNQFGQLGLGDFESRLIPTQISFLKEIYITKIACGTNHSCAISERGILYTFGRGNSFQLGHGDSEHLSIPTVVQELLGNKIEKVSCGDMHTLEVGTSSHDNKILMKSWGTNTYGQLGLGYNFTHSGLEGDNKTRQTPVLVEFHSEVPITDICCGHYHTLLILGGPTQPKLPLDTLSLSLIEEKIKKNDDDYSELRITIKSIYSSIASLNASFLEDHESLITQKTCGINLYQVMEMYNRLLSLSSDFVQNALYSATSLLLDKLVKFVPHTPESLRVIFILFENPWLYKTTKRTVTLVEKFCSCILSLSGSLKLDLFQWLKNLNFEFFKRFVGVVQSYLSYIIEIGIDTGAFQACSLLERLYQANEEAHIIPYNIFYNETILKSLDLLIHYKNWKNSPNIFSICRYPFLLPPLAKSALVHIDAKEQMNERFKECLVDSLLGKMNIPFLILSVRREFIVEDAFAQIQIYDIDSLKKPLRVEFIGEEGLDAGGLSKEFFHLIIQRIFDINYGMFMFIPENGTYWFNRQSFESDSQFMLIGMALALAIYNGFILDIHFAPVVYKKLLNYPITFSDLKLSHPDLASSLQKLLDYPGDVSDFDLNFQITEDNFGQTQFVDLKSDGAHISVINENREEYVKLYTKYLLETSVQTQFDAFSKGFLKIAGSPILKFFRAEELDLLICGTTDEIDFIELEKVTNYEGYTKNSPIIKWFWEFVKTLTEENKKKLLMFWSGSNRIPIQGIQSIKFLIQRNGPDSNLLPQASTCYNILLLPEYSSKEKLAERLSLAIEKGSEGFGLQ